MTALSYKIFYMELRHIMFRKFNQTLFQSIMQCNTHSSKNNRQKVESTIFEYEIVCAESTFIPGFKHVFLYWKEN
jgi:hypothetical protein